MFKFPSGAACALALLTACGGGNAPQTSSAAQSAASPAARTLASIVIDAEGDSTMFGLETVGGQFVQAATPPPVALQAQLRVLFGAGVSVNGHGSPGANLDMALRGVGNYATPLGSRLATSPAHIVLENFGINDAFLSADDYRSNVRAFVDTVRASGKLPVLEEPNPVCSGHASLDELVLILNEVAREKAVPLVKQYDAIKALPNWQAMLPDCVHPDDGLYAFKAGREAEALAQLIRSLP